jgi:hypothetical protein
MISASGGFANRQLKPQIWPNYPKPAVSYFQYLIELQLIGLAGRVALMNSIEI